jgi:hypothetical protein
MLPLRFLIRNWRCTLNQANEKSDIVIPVHDAYAGFAIRQIFVRHCRFVIIYLNTKPVSILSAVQLNATWRENHFNEQHGCRNRAWINRGIRAATRGILDSRFEILDSRSLTALLSSYARDHSGESSRVTRSRRKEIMARKSSEMTITCVPVCHFHHPPLLLPFIPRP